MIEVGGFDIEPGQGSGNAECSSEIDTIERSRDEGERFRVEEWAVHTSVGRVRRRNEDAWAEWRRSSFMVADGMGGEAGGQAAAEAAASAFCLVADGSQNRWRDRLPEVNRSVRQRLVDIDAPSGGTTLVGFCLEGGRPTVVHLGDSRAYRLRAADLTLELLTVDHNVANELRAAGKSVEGYERSGGRADALTRYLGGPEDFVPSEHQPSLSSGDRILLCSDGVHGQLTLEEIGRALSSDTCEAAAVTLVSASDEAGGRDNATALVLEVVSDG